ncbi:hypothetical protein HPB48_006175 [Haemaphysalis longicornis]|uniref:Uncharacterized protein n=1 Tax=Haemaphysalis longicornis TaxID=44386 RepID=A0A9J6H009_HAELO|nr:hypothetical protein HPB48_006175 [Haemaphysalis longicornis]
MDFVPRTTTTIVLHVGTNDIAKTPAESPFNGTKSFSLPSGMTILKSVPSMRLSSSLAAMIGADNGATGWPGLFYLDRGLEWLPSARVFAADGIHPNFAGVVIMASHLHRALLRSFAGSQSTWLQHGASAPSQQVQGQAPSPPPPPPTTAALSSEAPSTRP